jgi:cyclohexyl-isocyanide hydratase
MVFAAGVTAGIDGAQATQLSMQYAPEPPFNCGAPETAPASILEHARRSVQGITAQREATARRVAGRLGVALPAAFAV